MSLKLRKEHIEHILQSIAAITQHDRFVIVGTGAVIARVKPVPLGMMMTREIDVYAEGERGEEFSELIDGTLGEASSFDSTHGYYAHGVGERTAVMPGRWKTRAIEIPVRGYPDVKVLCPEPHDVAISKVCAWREKDREWLVAGLESGTLKIDALSLLLAEIDSDRAPPTAEMKRRIASIWPAQQGLPMTAKAPGGWKP